MSCNKYHSVGHLLARHSEGLSICCRYRSGLKQYSSSGRNSRVVGPDLQNLALISLSVVDRASINPTIPRTKTGISIKPMMIPIVILKPFDAGIFMAQFYNKIRNKCTQEVSIPEKTYEGKFHLVKNRDDPNGN